MATNIASIFDTLMLYYPLTAFATAIVCSPVFVYMMRKHANDNFDSMYFGIGSGLAAGVLWPVAFIILPIVFVSWIALRLAKR